jgi:hypothetical protein
MKTTIPEGPGKSTPDAGARRVQGKSIAPEATLRKGFLPKGEATKEAQEVKGAAGKAIRQQVGANGNPKKRDANTFGTGHSAAENEKELK